MTGKSSLKIAGYSLSLGIPLLAPLGVAMGMTWLSLLVGLGVFPLLGLLCGEDRSLPILGLRRSPTLVAYLDNLPRLYALVWMTTIAWAATYAAHADLTIIGFAGLVVSVGVASAVALPTAHELMHRAAYDRLLARIMASSCLYGHMVVEHFHHHATLGNVAAGETAPRGMSVFRFAYVDFLQGLRNAWTVETARLRRQRAGWWRNQVLQDHALGLGLALLFFAILGSAAFVLIIGQAVFAVFCFEVITYVQHYGLVRAEEEEPGPQHAWAHHCWLTNCLTFNNTFHGDHHLRPGTPYYELHAMYGSPRLPANYSTMFGVALVPPLWRMLMDKRLDALAEAAARGEFSEELRTQHCR